MLLFHLYPHHVTTFLFPHTIVLLFFTPHVTALLFFPTHNHFSFSTHHTTLQSFFHTTTKLQSFFHTHHSINSNIQIDTYLEGLTEQNALSIVKPYSVVVDASDNVASRYLANDACVLAGKPLVSGSSVRFEGQLTVYNYNGGPCYRCLFPQAPPPETVTSCADGGVMGVIPGIIGCLQALEAQKVLMQFAREEIMCQRMTLFNGKSGTFRTVKLRPRLPSCAVCGDEPTIVSVKSVVVPVCTPSKQHPQDTLSPGNRTTVHQLLQVLENQEKLVLLDVRDAHQFDICSLPSARNIPLKQLGERIEEVKAMILEQAGSQSPPASLDDIPVYVICRRGFMSVAGTKKLLEHGISPVKNVDGGVTTWAKLIDPKFPTY